MIVALSPRFCRDVVDPLLLVLVTLALGWAFGANLDRLIAFLEDQQGVAEYRRAHSIP